MGVLNVTPDSFYDGGRHNRLDLALQHAERMLSEGAAIIDVGGESTRPGAENISIGQELDRVIPVVECLTKKLDVIVSIDTSKAEVMQQAVIAGAGLINDVSALRGEGALQVAANSGVPVCLMHMQGQPQTMQNNPEYADVMTEVDQFLRQRISACENAGISRDQIILDPGFGFGKTLGHNMQLLQNLNKLSVQGLPVLVGLSRKSMLGALLAPDCPPPPEKRLYAGLAGAVIAAMRGARIIRTHDVEATVDALKIVAGIQATA